MHELLFFVLLMVLTFKRATVSDPTDYFVEIRKKIQNYIEKLTKQLLF